MSQLPVDAVNHNHRRLGEIGGQTYENQRQWAPGFNPVVTAIILWNTQYFEPTVSMLRQIKGLPNQLLGHHSYQAGSTSTSPVTTAFRCAVRGPRPPKLLLSLLR